MTKRALSVSIGLASALLALAVAFAATQLTGLQGQIFPGPSKPRGPAPEFSGITRWFNSDPLTMGSLRGEVVWIDFWTYSCINCVRALPGVRAMHDRYASHGLRVIGVHSPEFAFEKDPANVADAIRREAIDYPVALDAEMRTWRAWGNQYWPRIYLVDAQGRIRYDHIGEGGESDLQDQVRTLLREAGRTSLPEPIAFDDGGRGRPRTPEIYAGFRRGGDQLANIEGYDPGAVTDHPPVGRDPKSLGTDGRFALTGKWLAQAEYIEAAEDGARIDLPFEARRVFTVASSIGGIKPVKVLLDGEPATSTQVTAGTLNVERSDLYRLIELDRQGVHVVTLVAPAGTRIYTFTFG